MIICLIMMRIRSFKIFEKNMFETLLSFILLLIINKKKDYF
jgi:hypothetical protein